MKLGIFTDPHYGVLKEDLVTRRPSMSLNKLKTVVGKFKEAQVDAIICLGDWITIYPDRDVMTDCLLKMAEVAKSVNIPIYTCMGNHDGEVFSKEEFKELTGFTISPCTFEEGDKKVILLDANYMRDGSPWPPHYDDWTATSIPKDEIVWLKNELNTEKTCFVGMHQCINPNIDSNHVMENQEEVRGIIKEAGNVPFVIQGHYHPGEDETIDGIRYYTLRALCEMEELNYLIYEF